MHHFIKALFPFPLTAFLLTSVLISAGYSTMTPSQINVLLQSGDYSQARGLSEKAYRENPSDLAIVLLYAKTMQDAVRALDLYKKIAADTLFPDSLRSEAYFRLGCAAYIKGRFQKAGIYLKKAAPLPENRTGYAARCLNAVHDTADTAFCALLSHQAADTSSYEGKMACYFLGLFCFAKKDYAASLRHFNASAGTTSDTQWWACGSYAGAYHSALSLGRSEEAASILAHLKRVYPQYLEKNQMPKVKTAAATPTRKDTAVWLPHDQGAKNEAAAAKAPARKGTFSLQVGAFGSAENAGSLKTDLGKRYSPVSIMAAIVGDKPIFRVRVGVFDAKESAQAFGDTALTKKGLKFRIVEDVPAE
jgi:cell division septation protein DedD/signal recognition particle subunit SEC65